MSIFSEKITPPYYTLYSNAQHVLRPESKPCVTSPLEMVFIPAKITNRTDVQYLPLLFIPANILLIAEVHP